jgi:hypothetical protein
MSHHVYKCDGGWYVGETGSHYESRTFANEYWANVFAARLNFDPVWQNYWRGQMYLYKDVVWC